MRKKAVSTADTEAPVQNGAPDSGTICRHCFACSRRTLGEIDPSAHAPPHNEEGVVLNQTPASRQPIAPPTLGRHMMSASENHISIIEAASEESLELWKPVAADHRPCRRSLGLLVVARRVSVRAQFAAGTYLGSKAAAPVWRPSLPANWAPVGHCHTAQRIVCHAPL